MIWHKKEHPPSAKDAPRLWIYRNLTPWRIDAHFDARGRVLPQGATPARDGDQSPPAPTPAAKPAKELSIPPLGEVTVPNVDARDLDTLEMRRLGQLEVRPAPSERLSSLPRAIVIFGWLAVLLFFGGWALFFGGASAVPWRAVAASVVAVPVIALVAAGWRELHVYRRFDRYRRWLATEEGKKSKRSLEGIERGSRVSGFVDGMPRQVAEALVLVSVVTVSVIGLGIAIHQTTQLEDLLPIHYGRLLRLRDPFLDVKALALNSPAFWELLVARIAQWVLVSIAALAPAAMYFQFDRQRLAAVQRRWVHEVFRLDPTVRTVKDIEAKYGSQIESSFGHLGPDSRQRLSNGRRSPVIVATILLVVGWFLIISTTKVPDLVPVPTDSAIGGGSNGLVLAWPASDAVGQASAANAGSFPVADFFWPVLSPVGYAFLGAYVFTLFHVLRGYQRRDLHAKTYNTVVVRILSAYVLALVVTVVYTGEYAGVFLFFVGFTPQSALVWLRERLSDYRGRLHAFPLKEPSPLTDLEGIDLYDRTRLAEEGINNVEALAHADIVELMSSTRISAAQLVDWTDQAILYLRVGGDSSAKNRDLCSRGSDGAPADDSPAAPAITDGEDPGGPPSGAVHCVPDVRVNLCHLRSYGIRTATDLLEVYHQALRRGCDNPDRRAAEVNALRTALELPNGPRDRQVRTIQTIIDTLPDEEWFVQVRNWRRPEFGSFDSWYRYLDGTGWQLRDKLPLPARVTEAMQQLEPIPMASVAAGVPPCGAAEAQPTGAEASDAVPALTTSTEHVEEPGPDVAEPTPIMDAVLTL